MLLHTGECVRFVQHCVYCATLCVLYNIEKQYMCVVVFITSSFLHCSFAVCIVNMCKDTVLSKHTQSHLHTHPSPPPPPTQFVLNHGKPVGTSIPATEHSVMTAWPAERDAIERMIDEFGDGLFACVLDSYDYSKV